MGLNPFLWSKGNTQVTPGVSNEVAGGNVTFSFLSSSVIILTRRKGGLKSTFHGLVSGSSLGK